MIVLAENKMRIQVDILVEIMYLLWLLEKSNAFSVMGMSCRFSSLSDPNHGFPMSEIHWV